MASRCLHAQRQQQRPHTGAAQSVCTPPGRPPRQARWAVPSSGRRRRRRRRRRLTQSQALLLLADDLHEAVVLLGREVRPHLRLHGGVTGQQHWVGGGDPLRAPQLQPGWRPPLCRRLAPGRRPARLLPGLPALRHQSASRASRPAWRHPSAPCWPPWPPSTSPGHTVHGSREAAVVETQ
jgi:hypothetical protein